MSTEHTERPERPIPDGTHDIGYSDGGVDELSSRQRALVDNFVRQLGGIDGMLPLEDEVIHPQALRDRAVAILCTRSVMVDDESLEKSSGLRIRSRRGVRHRREGRDGVIHLASPAKDRGDIGNKDVFFTYTTKRHGKTLGTYVFARLSLEEDETETTNDEAHVQFDPNYLNYKSDNATDNPTSCFEIVTLLDKIQFPERHKYNRRRLKVEAMRVKDLLRRNKVVAGGIGGVAVFAIAGSALLYNFVLNGENSGPAGTVTSAASLDSNEGEASGGSTSSDAYSTSGDGMPSGPPHGGAADQDSTPAKPEKPEADPKLAANTEVLLINDLLISLEDSERFPSQSEAARHAAADLVRLWLDSPDKIIVSHTTINGMPVSELTLYDEERAVTIKAQFNKDDLTTDGLIVIGFIQEQLDGKSRAKIIRADGTSEEVYLQNPKEGVEGITTPQRDEQKKVLVKLIAAANSQG